MEVNTGAAVSIISDKTRSNSPKLQNLTLQPSSAKLRTYTGETIPVLGELIVELCDMKFFLCPMSWEFMSRYEHMSRYKLTYYRAMFVQVTVTNILTIV